MKISLSLVSDVAGGMYINFNGSENLAFTHTDIDWGSFNGNIDIFIVLERLASKFNIKNLTRDTVLELIPGRGMNFKFSSSKFCGKVIKIDINGRGQSYQLIQVANCNDKIINITHGSIDNLLLEEDFGNINLAKDLSIQTIKITGKGDGFIAKELRINKELDINGAHIKNDFLLEDITFLLDADDGTRFSIYGSTIGKISLKNLELPKGGLIISNSNILNVYFYRVNLERLKLIGVIGKGFGNLIQEGNKPSEMKEFYRQLKHSHDEIGNKTEANKFFAKEMEYHMKSLEKDPEKIWEYRVAWLQKEVSDFGNNWMRPTIIYFIVCLLGFGIAQISLALWNWIFCIGDLFQSGTISLKEITSYLNPLPKIDEVPGPWYLLVSVIKLLLVYQITVALRRISQR